MSRMCLRDDQFERIAALLPDKASDFGRTVADKRMFVEAVLRIARPISPALPFSMGIEAVIPPRSHRLVQRPFD